MTNPEFAKNFTSLITGAIQSGVSVDQILLCLDGAKFELQFASLQIHQQQAAQAMTGKIIPCSGKLPPFTPPAGRG